MDLEDQQRFQVEAQQFMGEPGLTLTCSRCGNVAILDGEIDLAELNQRADEHTEVCR